MLTKYTAGLLPVLVFWQCWRHRSLKMLLVLVIPVAMLLGWSIMSYLVDGEVHLLTHLRGQEHLGPTKDPLQVRILILLRTIGAVFPWTLIALLISCRIGWKSAILACIGVLIAVGVGVLDMQMVRQALAQGSASSDQFRMSHFAVFTANGAAAMILFALLETVRWVGFGRHQLHTTITNNSPTIGTTDFAVNDRSDHGQSSSLLGRELLLIWFGAAFAFNLFVLPKVPFGAVRHASVFLLPMGLLLLAHLAERIPRRSLLVVANVAFGLLLTVALAHADYVVAGAHRQMLVYLQVGQSQQQKSFGVGDPVYRAELQALGGIPVPLKELPERVASQPRALVVMTYSQNNELLHITRDAARCTLFPQAPAIKRITLESANPCRTVAQMVNFYAGIQISLPWEIAWNFPSEMGFPSKCRSIRHSCFRSTDR